MRSREFVFVGMCLLGVLTGIAEAADPCAARTGIGTWQTLPDYPTPLTVTPQGTLYNDGKLYVYEAARRGAPSQGGHVLDLCSGQWTPFVVNEDVPEWRQRPAQPGLLDIYTAAGPAYRPLSDGQTVSTPGGWLRPKLHVPRPYMGLHQLGGRPLQRDDGPTVTLAEAGAPSARRPGTYVFRLIGETLVVWGGLEADGWTHTGATFDIASGSWRPMSLTGAPPAMLKVKAAAWTGPYLTVLGTHRETRAPLGGRYHVAQDRWAPVALEGIPSWAPGGESIAIGAGERVIILDVRPQQPSQGAVYHATEDRWSSLQAPRSLYPANRLRVASAGSRLFFLMPSQHWAAFLNPTTMTWEEVSLARSGLPDRSEASYHWTGERLLVWGGVQRRVVDAGGGCENHDPSEGGCDPVPPTYATEVYTKGRIFRPDPTPH